MKSPLNAVFPSFLRKSMLLRYFQSLCSQSDALIISSPGFHLKFRHFGYYRLGRG